MEKERAIHLYKIISDNEGKPQLKIEKTKEVIGYDENSDLSFSGIRETVLTLCEMTNLQKDYCENEYIALYDYNQNLMGFGLIATGGLTEVNASRRKKATYILLSGAFYFRIFHNHPNIGDLDLREPSEGDLTSAQGDKQLSFMLEVKYVGNYIISKSGFRCVDDNDDYEFDDIDYEWIYDIQEED